jgi:hypothetical protein
MSLKIRLKWKKENNMKKIIISISTCLMIFVFGILSGTLISGCKTAPKRKNYKMESCFAMADCIYQIGEKNISECRILIEQCGISYDEKRLRNRHEYCMKQDNRADRQTYNECMLQLVPKK